MASGHDFSRSDRLALVDATCGESVVLMSGVTGPAHDRYGYPENGTISTMYGQEARVAVMQRSCGIDEHEMAFAGLEVNAPIGRHLKLFQGQHACHAILDYRAVELG
jgi:hypothetical protein